VVRVFRGCLFASLIAEVFVQDHVLAILVKLRLVVLHGPVVRIAAAALGISDGILWITGGATPWSVDLPSV